MKPTARRWTDIRAFLRDQRGSIATITAIFFPIVVGVATFGVDHMRASQQLGAMQHVADAAALASARQLAFVRVEDDDAGQTDATLTAIADSIVQNTLDDGFPETATMARVLTEGRVEVALTARYGSLFGELGAFGENPFTVTAVAQSFGGKNICFIALGNDEDEPGIEMKSSSLLDGETCEVYSSARHQKSVVVEASARLNASLVCAAGGYKGSASNYSQIPQTDCPQIDDPLADYPIPPMGGTCDFKDLEIDGVNRTIDPGVYCGNTKIKDGADVWMNPGIYIFRGGELKVEDDSRLAGEGVGLYFDDEKADFEFKDESEVRLSAPENGHMAGMLIAARPVCKGGDVTVSATVGSGPVMPGCDSGRKFEISSSNVRALLGTIHLPRDTLKVHTTMPVSEEAAFTIVVVGRLELSQSPTLVLNTDFGATNVPVPSGFRDEAGIPRLIQ